MVPERKLELVDKVTDLLKERMPTKAYLQCMDLEAPVVV